MADHIVVFMTAPTADVAARIGRAVVDEGLAACATIVPGARSIYRWEGKTCDDAEVLCVLKSRADRFDELRARIQGLHPYEVPEILAVPVAAGSEPYLRWVEGACRRG